MPDQPASIPPDDPSRRLTVARPDDDQSLPHIGLVGDTYTILVTGQDTAGKYTLIDMHVPPGGGPPPLDAEAQGAFVAKSRALAPSYKTELLPPPGRD
jgi:hypothetical protein